MSDDTTTIEITEAQRDELKARKQHEREGYKDVLARLLTDRPDTEETPTQVVDVRELASAFPELEGQLDRIENAAKTAEERTGTIERKVDDLR